MFHITTACTALTSLNPLTFFSTLPHSRLVPEKNIWSFPKNIFCCSVRVHATGGDVRHLRRGHPRRGPPGPHQPVPDQQQLRAGHHVRPRHYTAKVIVIVKVIVILMAGTMTSPCWRTTTWPWHSSSSRTQTVISSSTSPRSRGRPSGKWL